MARVAKFLVRKTAAQWAASNPILGLGTFGIELTTNQLKIGDGATDWAGLHYAASPYDLSLGPTARTEQHPAEVWRLANPVLGDQIVGYESDTHRGKIGDGITPWRSLAYINGREPVGIMLLESGAALLLEDGSLLLLAGGTVDGGTVYEFTTRIEVLGGGGASLLAARTTSIQITGGAGAGLRARTRITVQGGAGAGLLNTTAISIVGGAGAGLAGLGTYPMADIVADALGINVHLEYGGSVYDTGYATIVRPRLNELGTRHIRGGVGSGAARTTAITRYQQLAAQGIKLLLVNTSYVADVAYAAAHLDYVEALENRNEPDVFDNSPTDNWKAGLRSRHITFWNAVRGNPALNAVPVLPSPLGHANNLDWWHSNFADVGSYCDAGSVHDYTNDAAGKNIPEQLTANQGGGWIGFGQYYTNTQVEAKLRTDLGPDKAIWSTEIGPRYDGAAASTEHQAAKAVARHLLTRVLTHGRKRLYFYQLIENSGSEDFGLLTAAGAPRQAFNALRNLVALFRDQGPAFQTTALGYALDAAAAEYPPALTTYPIPDQSTFNTRIAAAIAGDHLVIADGVSLNGFTTTKSGTAANPIVIRAATNQGASFSGTVGLLGSYLQIWGMDLGTSRLNLGASPSTKFLRARRCRFHGSRGSATADGPITINVEGPDHSIEYCTLDDMQFYRGIWNNPTGYRLNVDRCLFKDFTGTASHQTYEPFATGEGANTHILALNVRLANSVFKNINLGTDENEAVSVKSSGLTIDNCLFDDARNMNIRFGNNGVFRRVTVSGNGEINLHGSGHLCNAVEILGSGKSFNFVKGNADGALATAPASGAHPSAFGITLIGCTGPIRVGDPDYGAFRAKQIKTYGHSGAITNVQGGTLEVTTPAGSPPEAALAAADITEAACGVYAP